VEPLERAAGVERALCRGGEFRQYLEALRSKNKPKRSLQKRIQERRCWLYLE